MQHEHASSYVENVLYLFFISNFFLNGLAFQYFGRHYSNDEMRKMSFEHGVWSMLVCFVWFSIWDADL